MARQPVEGVNTKSNGVDIGFYLLGLVDWTLFYEKIDHLRIPLEEEEPNASLKVLQSW